MLQLLRRTNAGSPCCNKVDSNGEYHQAAEFYSSVRRTICVSAATGGGTATSFDILLEKAEGCFGRIVDQDTAFFFCRRKAVLTPKRGVEHHQCLQNRRDRNV